MSTVAVFGACWVVTIGGWFGLLALDVVLSRRRQVRRLKVEAAKLAVANAELRNENRQLRAVAIRLMSAQRSVDTSDLAKVNTLADIPWGRS